MNGKKGRVLALVLVLVMVFGFTPALVVRAEADVTVFISVEGFNLGHGFYVEPTMVSVPHGTNAWEATSQLLQSLNLEYAMTDWGGLDRIFGIHPETSAAPPAYITIELGEGADDGSIGTFDYTEYSGWMFTVNHFMLPFGAADHYVEEGDVIRWQFSLEGWGADLGLDEGRGFWTDGLFEHADKTVLIRAASQPDVNPTSRADALEVIINPLASMADVNAALGAFAPPQPSPDPGLDLNQILSRGQLVSILWSMEGEPSAVNAITFDDVDPNSFEAGAIAWAAENGIVSGHGDGTFAPADNITREQFAVILFNFAGASAMSLPFDYDNNVSSWAIDAMQWALENGIIQSIVPGALAPQDNVTRSEFNTAMFRLSEYLYLEG